MRPIDADAMIDWIDCGHLRSATELCYSETDIVRMLNKQPTIDAEPVRHGKWVRHKPNGIIWTLKCSECDWIDNRITLNAKFNYCPNCGAKMT